MQQQKPFGGSTDPRAKLNFQDRDARGRPSVAWIMGRVGAVVWWWRLGKAVRAWRWKLEAFSLSSAVSMQRLEQRIRYRYREKPPMTNERSMVVIKLPLLLREQKDRLDRKEPWDGSDRYSCRNLHDEPCSRSHLNFLRRTLFHPRARVDDETMASFLATIRRHTSVALHSICILTQLRAPNATVTARVRECRRDPHQTGDLRRGWVFLSPLSGTASGTARSSLCSCANLPRSHPSLTGSAPTPYNLLPED